MAWRQYSAGSSMLGTYTQYEGVCLDYVLCTAPYILAINDFVMCHVILQMDVHTYYC